MLNFTPQFETFLPAFGSVRRDLARAFDAMEQRAHLGAGLCRLSTWEDDTGFHVEADVPGVAQEDLEVRFEDGRLWIRGERKNGHPEAKMIHCDRTFGKFERGIALSEHADASQIEATVDEGVLRVRIGRKAESQPRTVSVNYLRQSGS